MYIDFLVNGKDSFLGFVHLIFLAIIQGLTEFVPISSSAHLAVIPIFFSMARQSIGVDIAIHIGSLIAVCQIFRNDLGRLFSDFIDLILENEKPAASNFFLLILFSSVPIVIATIILFSFGLIDHLRNLHVIAVASILFAIPLFLADKAAKKTRSVENLNLSDVIYIGFWQAFAIIPGASRSGCCITGSLMRGFKTMDSAHISLIMSVPTILGSSILLVLELSGSMKNDFLDQNLTSVLYCIIFSYISAFLSIKIFFHLIRKLSFLPFIIYRILFGLSVLSYLVFFSAPI